MCQELECTGKTRGAGSPSETRKKERGELEPRECGWDAKNLKKDRRTGTDSNSSAAVGLL